MIGDELQKLLEPTIGRLGYELMDIEARLNGRNGVLRLTIDSPDGIGLEDCEKVSHAASALLDVEDLIPGEYSLEVSSPGLDRKLKKVVHFQRFEGETLKVTMRSPIHGRKNFRGILVSSDDENIAVEVDGVMHSLPLATIDIARLVPKIHKSQGKFGDLVK
ncbi:MAG: ribosome maturation factor RimP [Woeseiaceae bacterium]|nr:ribosome maturation factor RimP [Woeseiaceae bacterium]